MSEIDLSDFETAVGIYGEQLTATLNFASHQPDQFRSTLNERQERCVTAMNSIRALELWHEGDPFFLKAAREEARERLKGIHATLNNLGGSDE